MASIGGRRIVASEKIFDTGTPEGKAQLSEEAVVAVNSNKKLREGLTVSSLSSLIKGYQSHVRRYDTSLLTTLQAGEEGQESITLAASAANDMLERLKTFSSSAQHLKTYVDDFRSNTKPLEHARSTLEAAMAASERLKALCAALQELREMHCTPSTTPLEEESSAVRSQALVRSGDLIVSVEVLWPAFEAHARHPRMAAAAAVRGDVRESVTKQCRQVFKLAIAAANRSVSEVDQELCAAAAHAADAIGLSLLKEITDGFCSAASYSFYLPWAPNDASPDDPWPAQAFTDALERLAMFVQAKEPDIVAVFPHHWGMHRQLARRVFKEAQQTLRARLNDMSAAYVASNHGELVKMLKSAHQFESQIAKLWPAPRVDFVPEEGAEVVGCLSEALSEFLVSHDPSFRPPERPVNQTAAVFSLNDIGGADMDTGRQQVEAGVEAEGMEEIGSLDREDVRLLSVECMVMCTELGAGLTSFGQLESDREGLQTARIQMEITKRGFKGMLYFLDLANRDGAWNRGGKHDGASWGLDYRLALLRLAREANYPQYNIYGRHITFNEWKRAQLRLIMALVRACLCSKPKRKHHDSPSDGDWPGDLLPGVPGGDGGMFSVRDDNCEYSSSQLLASIEGLCQTICQMKAPNMQLWQQYCEPLYARVTARLQNQVAAVFRKFPVILYYGKLTAYFYENLVYSSCFDQETGSPSLGAGEALEVLRAFREAFDVSEVVHASALAIASHRQYTNHQDASLLHKLTIDLERVLSLPAPSPSKQVRRLAGGAVEYREEVLSIVAADLDAMLCDTHGSFHDPQSEIPLVLNAFLASKRGLVPIDAGESAWNARVREMLATKALKMSVRRRFTVMTSERIAKHHSAEADQDGSQQEARMSVDDCIAVVNELVEEVDTECMYYAPGFAAHLSRPTGVAVLEYVRCCREEVEGVVGGFATLTGEAVLLWRAVMALQIKVRSVLTGEEKGLEGTQAVDVLQGFGKLFRRCVDAWMDEQTNRYAEVLEKCIQFEVSSNWQALPLSGVSSSVVDLFQLFHESVPQLFRLGLPISRDDTLNMVEKVDLFCMKYCNEMLIHHYKGRAYRLDPSSLMPRFIDRRDLSEQVNTKYEEYFTAEGRQAAKVRKEMERPARDSQHSTDQLSRVKTFFAGGGKGGEQAGDGGGKAALEKLDKMGDRMERMMEKSLAKTEKMFGMGGGKEEKPEVVDPLECVVAKDPRLEDQNLTVFLIKLKNLAWARQHLEALATEVTSLWNGELERRGALHSSADEAADTQENAPLPPLFDACIYALNNAHETLVEYVAVKVIYFDLRDEFVCKLYYPTPRSSRLAPLIVQDGKLDGVLTRVSEEFGVGEDGSFTDLMWQVFEQFVVMILRVMERCAVGEGMGAIKREFIPSDSTIVKDDIKALVAYFCQPDEEGVSHGLEMKLVKNHSRRLEWLANRVLILSTEKLLETYYSSVTPEDETSGGDEVVNRKNILGALARRGEKEAKELLKDLKKKSKAGTHHK